MNNIKELDDNNILLIKNINDFVIEKCNDNYPSGTGMLLSTYASVTVLASVLAFL